MGLFRLVYHSRSCLDPAAGPLSGQMESILIASATRNRMTQVTGALVYGRAWFLQVLEGDRMAVLTLMQRIACDPRHCEVAVAQSGAASGRLFPRAWMAGVAWPEKHAGLFVPVVGERGFDPREVPDDALVDLVAAVVQHEGKRKGRTTWTTGSATSAA
jgi:hypothetical protein